MKKMEAKLIKKNNNYYLKHNDKIIGTIDAHPLSSINVMKLSLKNCQEIELGYDLDELAKEFVDYEDSLYHSTIKNTYMHGFQKALEILGDKKFSEDDVNLAFVLGKNKDESRINKLINSRLEQTEWDVEICNIMDCIGGNPCNGTSFECNHCTNIGEPKLDANGCLILKRK